MNVGDTVYMAYAGFYAGSVIKTVQAVTVAAIVDGRPLYKTLAGLREPLSVETIHETEAEAWGEISIRLSKIAADVLSEAAQAAAKSARGAVEVTA